MLQLLLACHLFIINCIWVLSEIGRSRLGQ